MLFKQGAGKLKSKWYKTSSKDEDSGLLIFIFLYLEC